MSDTPNISTIELSKEVSDFIESNGNNSDGYYWFPFYFKKVGDELFKIAQFKEIPGELKHIVERDEDPNPEGNIL